MKRFLLHILLFFAVVFMVDLIFGKAMDHCYLHAKGGDEYEMNDVCIKNQYDVLVMGSSRAHHHYDPGVIADSLGMSCYNAGKDGNGVILMYGMYKLISERYKPLLVIYDIAQGFDIYVNPQDQNNTRYLSLLKPYARSPHMGRIFESYSWQEWVKTYSNLYRYNSISVGTIEHFLRAAPFDKDGFEKRVGTMNYEPELNEKFLNAEVDPFKLKYFEDFILTLKEDDVPLICVLSPCYKAESSDVYNPAKELCTKHGISVWDYYADAEISNNRDYFKDRTHMNEQGAKTFSAKLAHDLITSRNTELFNTLHE